MKSTTSRSRPVKTPLKLTTLKMKASPEIRQKLHIKIFKVMVIMQRSVKIQRKEGHRKKWLGKQM